MFSKEVFAKSFNKSVSSLPTNAPLKPCLTIILLDSSMFSSSVKICSLDALALGIW